MAGHGSYGVESIKTAGPTVTGLVEGQRAVGGGQVVQEWIEDPTAAPGVMEAQHHPSPLGDRWRPWQGRRAPMTGERGGPPDREVLLRHAGDATTVGSGRPVRSRERPCPLFGGQFGPGDLRWAKRSGQVEDRWAD